MNVLYTKSARADIVAIFDYISRDNENAARQVVAQIAHAIARLSQFPQSGRLGAVKTTREVVVPHIPFIVVYRVMDDTVEIIAVFHVAQNRPRTS